MKKEEEKQINTLASLSVSTPSQCRPAPHSIPVTSSINCSLGSTTSINNKYNEYNNKYNNKYNEYNNKYNEYNNKYNETETAKLYWRQQSLGAMLLKQDLNLFFRIYHERMGVN